MVINVVTTFADLMVAKMKELGVVTVRNSDYTLLFTVYREAKFKGMVNRKGMITTSVILDLCEDSGYFIKSYDIHNGKRIRVLSLKTEDHIK